MTGNKDNPKPRRWLQFSITALLVVTTICAILFAWWRDRTQLRQRIELEVRRETIEYQLKVQDEMLEALAEENARFREEIARQRAERDAQAALKAATSQATSRHEAGPAD